MPLIKIQGESEKRNKIYYQVDSNDRPIGVGGMGQVFKGICINEATGSTRQVAIKFMYDDLPPQAIERARREASIQLRNDNLIEMLGFIEVDETIATGITIKHYHVVSELLKGVSLADVLNGITKDNEGEEIAYAMKLLQDYKNDPKHFAKTIVINVLSGLMALHDAGYIHRDIDPSNIMITTDEHIKLIDFGICKQMNNLTTNDKSLTVAGRFMGKPEYAAPELAIGDIKTQNQTTDIYAVGILLYQCIVGHTPFEGARHEILEKQLKEKLPLSIINDKNLREIIATACQKKQEQRYQSCAQMRAALETKQKASFGLLLKNKKNLAAVTGTAIMMLAGIFIITSQKQGEAENIPMHSEFEQQKSQLAANLDSLMKEADNHVTTGLQKGTDNYEEKLMDAYIIYQKIKEELSQNIDIGISYPNLDAKIQKVDIELDVIKKELLIQAQQLEDLEETELAGMCRQRALAIDNFKHK